MLITYPSVIDLSIIMNFPSWSSGGFIISGNGIPIFNWQFFANLISYERADLSHWMTQRVRMFIFIVLRDRLLSDGTFLLQNEWQK